MTQLLEHCEHGWIDTGKSGVHIEFPTKTQGIKQLYAFYVQCAKCKQMGFKRYPHTKLIYTWVD